VTTSACTDSSVVRTLSSVVRTTSSVVSTVVSPSTTLSPSSSFSPMPLSSHREAPRARAAPLEGLDGGRLRD
jgi:hypothetical protein